MLVLFWKRKAFEFLIDPIHAATRTPKLMCKSFDAACVQCGHFHSILHDRQQVLFAFIVLCVALCVLRGWGLTRRCHLFWGRAGWVVLMCMMVQIWLQVGLGSWGLPPEKLASLHRGCTRLIQTGSFRNRYNWNQTEQLFSCLHNANLHDWKNCVIRRNQLKYIRVKRGPLSQGEELPGNIPTLREEK